MQSRTMIQAPFIKHQEYNTKIATLLGKGFKVYVVSYYKNNSIKYKVQASLYQALKTTKDYDRITVTKFELGATKPKSYWGRVEQDVMTALKNEN